MNRDNLKNLAKIITQIKRLQLEEATLKLSIIDDMEVAELDKLQTNLGTFTVMERVSYKFDDVINEQLQEIKDIAIRGNQCEKKVTKSLRFQGNIIDKDETL